MKELLQERLDLEEVIAAIGRLAQRKRGPGRPPKLFSPRGPGRPPGRRVSARSRAKMSAAQRQRWAKIKARRKE